MEKKANALYKRILTKKIYPMLGDKLTYAHELNKIGRKLFGIKFRGVFASDKIPKLNDLSPYCILNLDKSGQPGSHWIAFAKLPYPSKSAIVYDSFGRTYKRIIPFIEHSGNGRIKNTDDDAEQKINESDCGARSLAFLFLLDKYGGEVAMLI